MKYLSFILLLICAIIPSLFVNCTSDHVWVTEIAKPIPDSTFTGAKTSLWVTTIDPNNHGVYYIVDWGDGIIDTFPENEIPYNNGDTVPVYHIYEKWSPPHMPEFKNFDIKAIAKNEKGKIQKYWSNPVTIKVIYNEEPNRPIIILPHEMGGINTLQGFGATATDPEGDSVAFNFSFANPDQWTSFIASGETIFPDNGEIGEFHLWTEPGFKGVWVFAKDKKGSLSVSSETVNFEVIDEGYVTDVFQAVLVEEGEAETVGMQSSPAIATIGNVEKIFIGSEFWYAYIINAADMQKDQSIDPTNYRCDCASGWGNSPAVDIQNSRWYIANDVWGFFGLGTGPRLWVYPPFPGGHPGLSFTDAAFNGDYVYVATLDTLYALNGTNGSKFWGYSIPGKHIKTAPIIDVEGNVYIGDDSGYARKINGITGELIWQKDIGGRIQTSGAIGSDGTIYFCVNGTSENLLCALEPDSGDLRWSYSVGEKVTTSLAIDPQGYIYMGDDHGRIHTVNNGISKSGFPISLNTGGANATLSTPAFAADNYFYVMTKDQYVFCIGTDGQIRWETPLPTSDIAQIHGSNREDDLVPSPVIGSDGDIYVASGGDYIGLYRLKGRSSGFPANTPWPMFRHDRNHSGKAGFIPSRLR